VPIKTSGGGSAGQGFRKVVIEEVSGSEDEEDAAEPSASSTAKPAKSPENAGFRKVVITEDSDSEDDGDSGAGAKPEYIQAATYRGRKDGYIFTTRNRCTGYYLDSHGPRREATEKKPAAPAHNFAPPSRVQATPAPKADAAKKTAEEPAKKTPPAPPAAKAAPPPAAEEPACSFDDMD